MQTTIDSLSMEAFARAEKEVGALIGTELKFALLYASLMKKQGFLENLDGRNSIIGLQMRGRYEGDGCLVAAEDCAVRLAGKMLMLPSTELNDIISAGSYSDENEISFAFDDIARCLILSFLHTFQGDSNFISTVSCQSQKCAEGKKATAEILSHLSSDQTFYVASVTITMAGVTTSAVTLLLPAFVLVCSEPFRKQTGKVVEPGSPADELPGLEQAELNSSDSPDEVLFPHLRPAVQQELSSLLGITVQAREKAAFSGPISELLRGTEPSSRLSTRILISGGVQGHGWLIGSTRDAMKLGLLLTEGIPGIMIPGSLAGDFTSDCQDGYQEICSIIVDALEVVCNDLSESELFMEKGALAEEAELKLDTEGRGGEDRGNYRQTWLELVADTLVIGSVQILLPVELYENLNTVAPAESTEETALFDQEAGDSPYSSDEPSESGVLALVDQADPVLLIDDSATRGPEILTTLEQAGIKGVVVSSADEVSKTELDSYRAVLLLLERLDEIGCGVVIKIKSTSSVPMLVAAASWTQTDVMKALRYGVDDILMLPLEGDELVHKLRGAEPLNA